MESWQFPDRQNRIARGRRQRHDRRGDRNIKNRLLGRGRDGVARGGAYTRVPVMVRLGGAERADVVDEGDHTREEERPAQDGLETRPLHCDRRYTPVAPAVKFPRGTRCGTIHRPPSSATGRPVTRTFRQVRPPSRDLSMSPAVVATAT